ncbi:baculovirus j domain protein [Spilosoma obliqua nucleopolyhedrosis virus]|nr:baculovirus j domain protein [Spilosoma obliqua nucleopolyhedrosis virus]
MAAFTRSRKRGAVKSVEEEEEEIDFVKRVKQQNRLCSFKVSNFLGYCSLEEINYYETLKLDFETKSTMLDNTKFALLVARMANVVTNQVRKYPSVTDMHFNNAVRDVLILIQHARSVLMDENKKRRYNNIAFHKNEMLQNCDAFINNFIQLKTNLTNAIEVFEIDLSALSNSLNIAVSATLTEGLENWLAAQPVLTLRPTSMNRILITWVSLLDEQNFNKTQTKQLIIDNFIGYGEIVDVYVCDIDTNTAIVEYKTQQGQRKAIEDNKSHQKRFTVTEYILKNFYNSQLHAKLRDQIINIESRLNNFYQQLPNITNKQLSYEIISDTESL